jgi:rubredoxin
VEGWRDGTSGMGGLAKWDVVVDDGEPTDVMGHGSWSPSVCPVVEREGEGRAVGDVPGGVSWVSMEDDLLSSVCGWEVKCRRAW